MKYTAPRFFRWSHQRKWQAVGVHDRYLSVAMSILTRQERTTWRLEIKLESGQVVRFKQKAPKP